MSPPCCARRRRRSSPCGSRAPPIWPTSGRGRCSPRFAPGRPTPLAEPHGRAVDAGAAYRQGFLSNLGNPKIAVFFISVLPQLAHGTSFVTFAVLGAVFCGLTFLWLAAYTVAVAKAGDVLRKPSVRRVLDGITGLVLIGFGLRLATEHR